MLVELAVSNLGVIEAARIPFGNGLVALTGETGAGKTMLIEALSLLAGHKADASRIRQGASEAVVEGLFAVGEEEWVLRRVVPTNGRSRAYVNGELATASTLADVASSLLELHGQHAQQKLFAPRAHREALDEFAGIDTTRFDELRSRVRHLESALSSSGGDERARLREIGLLQFQLDEIDAAAVRVGEDQELSAEESVLADAVAHVEASSIALDALSSEGAAIDAVSSAVAALSERAPYSDVLGRLIDLDAELTDCAAVVRAIGESIEPDPERLDQLQSRRAVLSELRRKYGDTDAAVIEYAEEIRLRLKELTSYDENLSAAKEELATARDELFAEGAAIGARRRASAPDLTRSIEEKLRHLAMPSARLEIRIEDSEAVPFDGSSVEFLISANPGVALGPLSKVASGGELSRVMLALSLVLTQSPPTTVFDEIDAGIGGEAAIEVGRALSDLAAEGQVLVVTHLPQVAAFADAQIRIEKSVESGSVHTTASALQDEDRVIELARMLSGRPDSRSARAHASDLLSSAGRGRGAGLR